MDKAEQLKVCAAEVEADLQREKKMRKHRVGRAVYKAILAGCQEQFPRMARSERRRICKVTADLAMEGYTDGMNVEQVVEQQRVATKR